MRISKKIKAILTVCLIAVLLAATPSMGKTIAFRHLISIYTDDKNMGLNVPEGVACGNAAAFIVADTGNGRLLKYTLEIESSKATVAEIKVAQISYPIKAKINSKGDIYVLDGKQRRIVRMAPEGGFIGYLEPRGLPDPSAYVPRNFDLDENDNIYVLDILSRRVLILSPAGDFQKAIAFPAAYGFFSDIAVAARGNILLVDSIQARVYSAAKHAAVFSPLTPSLKEYMRFPTSLDTDSRGRIYVVDRNGGRVIVLRQDGSFLSRQSARGWKEGRLNYPSQICINSKDEVFIADTKNNRVQIFTTNE